MTGPIIGSVVVVTAQGRMTWNAQDSDGVASTSLTVDGVAVSKINGPYATATGVNFSGVFGKLPPRTHSYAITAIDKLGNPSQYTGTFTIPALTGRIALAAWVNSDNEGNKGNILLFC